VTIEKEIPIVVRAVAHRNRRALIDEQGQLSYGQLLERSAAAATTLLDGALDLNGARVAFLTPPGIDYVIAQWATWRAGGVAVPLCTMHPAPELAYVIEDADASIIVSHPQFEPILRSIARQQGRRFLLTSTMLAEVSAGLPEVDEQRDAMLIYTSGTTGKPKGALSTHAILTAQIRSLTEAWEWYEGDHILHVLPLHHLHGIVNLLCSALYSGATCEFLPRFDVQKVWKRIAEGDGLTLFMAVPTIYSKLVQYWEQADEREQQRMSAGCQKLRLMVSGSAALPVAVMEKWRMISGHTLLERYGMTEAGMILGNPLHGERKPGYVGLPFPGVEVRLVAENGEIVEKAGVPGQIEVRGPVVFKAYWGRPEATSQVFTEDGWFKTGDIAVRESGSYRILGRQSIDILKTGGFKVYALEIEEVLRTHTAIMECAVVGVEDEEWGQRVAACVVTGAGQPLELEALRKWGKERLAHYKVPTLLKVVKELPRNSMSKVEKSEVVKMF